MYNIQHQQSIFNSTSNQCIKIHNQTNVFNLMSNQYIKFNLKLKYSIQRQTYVFLSTPKQCIQFNLTHMFSFQRQTYVLNFIQIYHVWEGYLRKIPVERRNLVSRLVFFVNTPPKHDISV